MGDFDKINMHAGATPQIFERARLLRANMTKEEEMLWNYLKGKPLGFKFRRQHPFNFYILDFYCHRAKLSIEIDGVSHDGILQKVYDTNRTQVIASFGVTEVRFKNQQVIENLHDIKREIIEFLKNVEQ